MQLSNIRYIVAMRTHSRTMTGIISNFTTGKTYQKYLSLFHRFRSCPDSAKKWVWSNNQSDNWFSSNQNGSFPKAMQNIPIWLAIRFYTITKQGKYSSFMTFCAKTHMHLMHYLGDSPFRTSGITSFCGGIGGSWMSGNPPSFISPSFFSPSTAGSGGFCNKWIWNVFM